MKTYTIIIFLLFVVIITYFVYHPSKTAKTVENICYRSGNFSNRNYCCNAKGANEVRTKAGKTLYKCNG